MDPMTPALLALLAFGPEPEPPLPSSMSSLAVGVHLGYYRIRDADEGTELLGAHLRWSPIPLLAVELSVDAAEADVEDGDGELSVVPVQLTAIVKPIPGLSFSPYVLGGVGWTFLDLELGDVEEEETDFAAHVGAGLEFGVGPLLFHADLRYVFFDPDFDDPVLSDESFDAWQAAVGASLRF